MRKGMFNACVILAVGLGIALYSRRNFVTTSVLDSLVGTEPNLEAEYRESLNHKIEGHVIRKLGGYPDNFADIVIKNVFDDKYRVNVLTWKTAKNGVDKDKVVEFSFFLSSKEIV